MSLYSEKQGWIGNVISFGYIHIQYKNWMDIKENQIKEKKLKYFFLSKKEEKATTI